jgi:hypothetical protein
LNQVFSIQRTHLDKLLTARQMAEGLLSSSFPTLFPHVVHLLGVASSFVSVCAVFDEMTLH